MNMSKEPIKFEPVWDTGVHQDFYRYYERQSGTGQALTRFATIQATILRMMGPRDEALHIADVGCGAGTQTRLWAARGHLAHGADINAALVELARQRAAQDGLQVEFNVASATSLPWADASMDVCIAPELLEHVADWRQCLDEFVRVLKPGGLLYLSTSNVLCPVQEEFDLPMYAWYPAPLKRYYERLAVTTRPELAGHATYPAVNWFSFYGLRRNLRRRGLHCLDRFDMIDLAPRPFAVRCLVRLIRALPPLRWLGHALTPYTTLLAFKPRA
jgi:ubiquinone/menaquinone biosynthesis C-methylase UbiE